MCDQNAQPLEVVVFREEWERLKGATGGKKEGEKEAAPTDTPVHGGGGQGKNKNQKKRQRNKQRQQQEGQHLPGSEVQGDAVQQRLKALEKENEELRQEVARLKAQQQQAERRGEGGQ